jgi:hypothetical protein
MPAEELSFPSPDSVWGGWVCDPPPGPDSAIIRDYVQQHRPLLIWDSLIDFHDGDEQSASETRAFMKHFRALANLGATVLILHHTGKTSTSQDYRGSSDIKAAVDMAYCLESEMTLAGGLRGAGSAHRPRCHASRHRNCEGPPR